MDFSSPYLFYVLASYGTAAVLLGGLALFSFTAWRRARKGDRR